MSGDEPLGDSHAYWHSAEESMISKGMSCTTTLYNMAQINKKIPE